MRFVVSLMLLILFHFKSYAQNADQVQKPVIFSGMITATNNGISLLPNFSLNKPAVLFDLSVAKGKLSFDPMFRFGMDGKPWSFIFWWRYKLINQDKFKMSVGAHPSFVFRTIETNVNNTLIETTYAQRYFAIELTPTYFINKKVSVGLYYLGSHGLSKDIIQYTHFLTLRSTMSNIELTKNLTITMMPQLYYLKMDKADGTYINGTFILSHKKSPISISSIVSQAFRTDILGKKLTWNVGLAYIFAKRYVKG
jgi:hypothetical protein